MSIIVMTDDDFEKNMQRLADQFHPLLAASFRARDTAQREALAIACAERDEAREFMRINAQSGMHYAEQRDTAQAQLAEAVRLLRSAEHQLLSFHREHESQWRGYLDDALGVIKHIIGKNAQAVRGAEHE